MFGGVHCGTDGTADEFDFIADAFAGFLGQGGELSYLVRHHGKSPPGFTGTRRLNGGVERQQIGLIGDAFHVRRHFLKLDIELHQLVYSEQHVILALGGFAEITDHCAQLLFRIGKHAYQTAFHAFGCRLRCLQCGIEPVHNAGETTHQIDDGGLHLAAPRFHMARPHRHDPIAQGLHTLQIGRGFRLMCLICFFLCIVDCRLNINRLLSAQPDSSNHPG